MYKAKNPNKASCSLQNPQSVIGVGHGPSGYAAEWGINNESYKAWSSFSHLGYIRTEMLLSVLFWLLSVLFWRTMQTLQ